MKLNTPSELSMTRIPGTTLYRGIETSSESMVFLLWDTTDPPNTLTIEQAWADVGAPKYVGYYVFLSSALPEAVARKFESQLREKLNPPVSTGFCWVVYKAESAAHLETVLEVKAAPNSGPVVAQTGIVHLPTGIKPLGFAVESPIVSSQVGGLITAFTVFYPPLPGADPPSGAGISIQMASGAVGCLRFDGLTNTGIDGYKGNRVRKALVHVQIDPIRPFDPNRTHQTFTGANYFLESTSTGYRLEPAR